MIGHQQFEKRLARIQHLFGIGRDFHARLDRTNAGGRKNARARVHDAESANAYGRLVLQMTQRGNGDAVHARGVENAGARRHAQSTAVNRDVNHSRRCGGGCHTKGGFLRAGLHRRAKRR